MGVARVASVFVLAGPLIINGCAGSADSSDADPLLSFEGSRNGSLPAGWSGGPEGTLFADDKVVHGGAWAGRIERTIESAGEFSTLTSSVAGTGLARNAPPCPAFQLLPGQLAPVAAGCSLIAPLPPPCVVLGT